MLSSSLATSEKGAERDNEPRAIPLECTFSSKSTRVGVMDLQAKYNLVIPDGGIESSQLSVCCKTKVKISSAEHDYIEHNS